MYFIGLDVHKKTISYCVKDAAGRVHQEGKVGSSRRELDGWIRTMHQPRMIAMEATTFTGWIYDHLLPHAEKVKVAHPVMLRALAAAKKKNYRPQRSARSGMLSRQEPDQRYFASFLKRRAMTLDKSREPQGLLVQSRTNNCSRN